MRKCSLVGLSTLLLFEFYLNQVRCMAAVLLMVGRRQEEPGIVARMLDINATPSKPQYAMAAEVRDVQRHS